MKRHLLLIICLTMLAAVTATPAFGQKPRKTCHPDGRQTQDSRCDNIYELWCVDEEPVFPGGERELIRYINAERQYPPEAYERRVSGRVLCTFVIDQTGAVGQVRVVRGVEETLDAEAVRIIENMPRWQPATLADISVSVQYVLPIPFRL